MNVHVALTITALIKPFIRHHLHDSCGFTGAPPSGPSYMSKAFTIGTSPDATRGRRDGVDEAQWLEGLELSIERTEFHPSDALNHFGAYRSHRDVH